MRSWRKIESGIVTSERLSKVSDSAKWLFTLLLVAQDDEGRYPWTPTMIRSLTVTTTWAAPDCESLLSELRVANVAELREGFVVLRNGAEKNGTPANSKKYVLRYPTPDLISTPNDESVTSRERVGAEALTIVQSRVDKIRVDKNKESGAKAPFVLPEWIDKKLWDSFMEVRRKKRAVQTKHALTLLIGDLEKIKIDGGDVCAALEQSIKRSYTGVFPVKENGGSNGRRKSGRDSQENHVPKVYEPRVDAAGNVILGH